MSKLLMVDQQVTVTTRCCQSNLHILLVVLFQEIKHFKQMCGNEAGATEIKAQGEHKETLFSSFSF